MSDYGGLRELGLSKLAVACYQSLFEDGAASAAQLAARLAQPRASIYRVLRQMEKQGFVISLKTHLQPRYFDVELLDKALKQHAEYQRQLADALVKEQAEVMARRAGKPAS